MLGIRISGVTEAAAPLQDAGLIRYSSGHIEVLDRPELEKRVCECYGVVKRESDRLRVCKRLAESRDASFPVRAKRTFGTGERNTLIYCCRRPNSRHPASEPERTFSSIEQIFQPVVAPFNQ